jgi:peptidoglycan/xylan/chitin deacetylase (PgdA/CDA1 family)
MVVFLATDYIGTGRPFIWDHAAFLFSTASMAEVDVPLIGVANLSTETGRDAATTAWVHAVKRLPGSQRAKSVIVLAAALHAEAPLPEMFRHLYLDWSEVGVLARQGVEFGGHTRTHPILTNQPLVEATAEIESSITRLTEALGAKPLGFAYPNGSCLDYSSAHEQAVARTGVPLAFSLEAGPMPLAQIRERRMAIRRIYIGAQDNMPRFVAKLAGLARLGHLLRRTPRRTEVVPEL